MLERARPSWTPFIEGNAHRDISAADIAAAAYVTVRALQLAFRRHLGTTPTSCLRRTRLAHAHHQLTEADPGHETVTAIAYQWGFSSSSRFAARCRRAYGVTPSETLRDWEVAEAATGLADDDGQDAA